jgi:hypothetical protein
MYMNISYINIGKLNKNREWRKEWERGVSGDDVCDCSLGELLDNKKPFRPLNSEHRELCSNMGMRIEYTIFLMMRLKSFRPEVDKSWQSRRECQK